MLLKSIIDTATLTAYEETHYIVQGDDSFTLHIGQFCPALAAAHKKNHVYCSAFITAFNPFSEPLSAPENAHLHADLGHELVGRGAVFMEGVGQHPSNQWPGEISYLVFGLPLEAAMALGVRFRQNAIIWSGANAVPQLVVLR